MRQRDEQTGRWMQKGGWRERQKEIQIQKREKQCKTHTQGTCLSGARGTPRKKPPSLFCPGPPPLIKSLFEATAVPPVSLPEPTFFTHWSVTLCAQLLCGCTGLGPRLQ